MKGYQKTLIKLIRSNNDESMKAFMPISLWHFVFLHNQLHDLSSQCVGSLVVSHLPFGSCKHPSKVHHIHFPHTLSRLLFYGHPKAAPHSRCPPSRRQTQTCCLNQLPIGQTNTCKTIMSTLVSFFPGGFKMAVNDGTKSHGVTSSLFTKFHGHFTGRCKNALCTTFEIEYCSFAILNMLKRQYRSSMCSLNTLPKCLCPRRKEW